MQSADMLILRALESVRSPFFNAVLGALTYLGDETLFMAAAIVLYWCFSKKWGYYLLATGFFGTLINQFAKILCRVPRPWVRESAFSIVESARAAATGYSFPSGHTASIVSVGGCIARAWKKTWLRIVCAALIAVVSFSRMYLGVHYPSDVLFSLVVGVVLVFAVYPLFAQSDEKPGPALAVIALLAALSLAFALFTELHAFPADTDPENLSHAVKNAWTLTGCGFGLLVGFPLERRYVNFDGKAVWWAQLLKAAVGFALIMAIRAGLKPLLSAVFGPRAFCNAIRYFCMVLFAACVWPLTFRRFATLGKKK